MSDFEQGRSAGSAGARGMQTLLEVCAKLFDPVTDALRPQPPSTPRVVVAKAVHDHDALDLNGGK